jgi:hypothetical protein
MTNPVTKTILLIRRIQWYRDSYRETMWSMSNLIPLHFFWARGKMYCTLHSQAQRRDCIGNEFGRCTQKTRRPYIYWIPILQISMEHICTAYSLNFYGSEGVSFYFVSFSCTAQIHKLKFKSEYCLRINIGSQVKNTNTGNPTLISWTMLIGFL